MANSFDLAPMPPPHVPQAPAGTVELLGHSRAIARVHELVRRCGDTDSAVLLVGERGLDVVGVARQLHARGARRAAPFIHVECAGCEAPDLDRELFGAPAGAPSDLDAVAADCRLAAARGGTLFLHEVTELPSAVQARLARILRDREVLIDGTPVPAAFRLTASALPLIDVDVQAQRFRADLYRRVAATRIDLPPLRDRASDVPELAARLLDDLDAGGDHRPPRTFTQAALALLAAMTWPGNLAELRDAVTRMAGATDGDVIQIEHVLPALQLARAPAAFVPTGNLREARLRFEREYIAAVLQHHGWSMADAAQTLGIQRPNLYRKARQLGILLSRTSA